MSLPPKNTRSGRRRLGRGLGSLLNTPVAVDVPDPDAPSTDARTPDSTAPPRKTPNNNRTNIPNGDDSPPRDGSESLSLTSHNEAAPADSAPAPPAHGEALAADDQSARAEPEHAARTPRIQLLPLDRIVPNPHQPRQHFDEDALARLGESIRRDGLMQPILVRPARRDGSFTGTPGATGAGDSDSGGAFELIAGERRWRAAKLIGLAAIPALIRYVDDRTAAELSLIENLQREDLDPIERAAAFRRLIEEFGLTQAEVAETVKLDRATVTNFLRLNELDEETKGLLQRGELSMSHARSLLGVTNVETRADLARRAARGQWSVREIEHQARRITTRTAESPSAAAADPAPRSPGESHLKDLQQRLQAHLGTKVQLHQGRKKGTGRLIIEFYTLDQFEGLMSRMGFDDSGT